MSKVLVIFDGDCGICSQFKILVETLDLFHKIDFKPFQDSETFKIYPFLDPAECEKEIQLIENHQLASTGADAIRRIFFKIPLFMPLACLLWLPGVRQASRWAYQYIAKNRHKVSATCGLKK